MAAVLKEEVKKPKARVAPIGPLIDGIWATREKKRALEAEVKILEAEIAIKEEALIARLDQEGVDASRGGRASVSITSTISASIADWDAFTAFVKKTGNFQLFQRRISDPAARELFETKGTVPGLAPFTKRRLNVRSL